MPRKAIKQKAATVKLTRRAVDPFALAKREGWAGWIRNEQDERAVFDGCRFDAAAGEHFITFCRQFLRHSTAQWAGQPFELIDWQRNDLAMPLFGWKRADGTRRFRHVFVFVAKKNGKSTLCSAIELYGLVGDGEQGAQVYSAACDRDQAGIVHRECAAMVRASEVLSDQLEVIDSRHRIHYHRTNSFIKALSADAKTKEGLNASMVVMDELHAWQNRVLFETLMYAGAARRQPIFIVITTAGFDRQSICYEQYDLAKRILANEVHNWELLPLIYEAAPEDDWKEPQTWHKANPSLGITINLDGFKAALTDAVQTPAKEASFRRYRLNQWTESDVRAIGSEAWAACKQPGKLAEFEGEACWGGLDLSSTNDLTAAALLFSDREVDGALRAFVHFWCPAESVEIRERKHKVPYGLWSRQGFLTLTPGASVDYSSVRRWWVDVAARFDLRKLGYDPYNAKHLCETQLGGEDGLPVEEVRQGIPTMGPASKEFERLILDRRLIHDGNPVLTWNAANLVWRTDPNGNYMPSKEKSREKIDGVVAVIDALVTYMRDPDAASGPADFSVTVIG